MSSLEQFVEYYYLYNARAFTAYGSYANAVYNIAIGTKYYGFSHIKWVSSRENLTFVACEQQRLRAACVSAQSAQRLCYSFPGKERVIAELATTKLSINWLVSVAKQDCILPSLKS